VRWEKEGIAIGQLDTKHIEAAAQRRRTLDILLREDKFQELTQQANREIAFLQADMERHRAAAAAAEEARLTRVIRTRENAATLLKMLQQKKPPPAPQLISSLDALSRGAGQLDESEKLLSQGFNALKLSETPAGLSEKQKALASRLAAGQVSSSFEEWKTANSQSSNDPRLQALIRSISELSLLGHSAEIEGFNKRLIELGDDFSALSSVRFDSLTLDVAAALADAKQRALTINAAKQVDTELASTAHAASATLRQQIATALKSEEISTLRLLIAQGREMLATSHKELAAHARREAVLQGLAALGYAVREGMATAWANSGRVVLDKPGLEGYGVEVAGNTEEERLQVKAVAFSTERDMSRDHDVETMWCGDFSRLQAQLLDKGHTLSIEKAFPIGAVPLKVVAKSSDEAVHKDRVNSFTTSR
jgi:hypothetical protein